MPNARDVYLMMKTVYEHFSSHKFDEPLPKQGKGRVKAIHYIQSFDSKDNISPEDAHKIGRTFARKAFGDNCQVVSATHTDKSHIHNHIIINTYGIDGQKFNDNLTTRKNLREISDRVCLAFGIKPIEPKARGVEYNEWEHKQRGTSWKQKIRLEIDGLILKVKNIDELLAELEMLGYTVRRGKYISVKAPDQQRAVRLKTLGEDYTFESLASRILWKDVGSGGTLLSAPSEMSERYAATIFDVEQLALNGRKVQRKRDPSAPYSPQNDMDLYKLSAQLTIINRDNLRSIGEVEGKIQQLEREALKIEQQKRDGKHNKL
ncbi:MAG: relaxase/mobilization nuclease domain-containing protein [Ruminococcus sp.]|nr:relaxase/mobilization nuclease domain-containing protein [Ruminococcus sp.]